VAIFESEGSEEWQEWTRTARTVCERYVNEWPHWDHDTRRSHYSRDDCWVNVNEIDSSELPFLPEGAALQFIQRVMEPSFYRPKAQVAVLMPGYPCGAAMSEGEIDFLQRGNLHLDGTTSLRPNALIVGILISDVVPEGSAGQPLYIPGSHSQISRALHVEVSKEKQASVELCSETVRTHVRRIRESCEIRCRVYGNPGTVFVYHGALIHGMAPNDNGNDRRDAVYFRFAYPDEDNNHAQNFLVPARKLWTLSGLGRVGDGEE
jgi:hypothetical protein